MLQYGTLRKNYRRGRWSARRSGQRMVAWKDFDFQTVISVQPFWLSLESSPPEKDWVGKSFGGSDHNTGTKVTGVADTLDCHCGWLGENVYEPIVDRPPRICHRKIRSVRTVLGVSMSLNQIPCSERKVVANLV